MGAEATSVLTFTILLYSCNLPYIAVIAWHELICCTMLGCVCTFNTFNSCVFFNYCA